MGELAKAVFEEIKLIEPQRTLHLKIKDLPAARGDKAMIRQVFVNLLTNAIKFTRPREVAIIEIGGGIGESKNLYFVRDNGVGFDVRDSDRLFNIFQRLHSAEEFEGTGVGLAIVKRIIQRHGGWVWAEGRLNEGATFYSTLPQGRPEAEVSKKAMATAGRKVDGTPPKRKKAGDV
jgi:light-regulated signal transduction histidine kinase (bacteriophytochrome)